MTDMAEDRGAMDMDASDGDKAAPVARPGKRRWLSLLLLVLGFAAGAGAAIVLTPVLNRWWHGATLTSATAVSQPAVAGRMPATLARISDPKAIEYLPAHIAELEDRLTRINVEAQAASGNAARAEGLLVAFAARRALDSGAPLGYIEGQLRLRFGQAQPRAVATIINAAREPVTLVDLQAGLDDMRPALVGYPPNSSWWSVFKREVRDLVIIRKSTTPSPLADRTYERAQRFLDSGRVDAALTEVERLPTRDAADRWTEMARRYREARRALDLIETAAILEPRQIRAGDGALVNQSSPLAP